MNCFWKNINENVMFSEGIVDTTIINEKKKRILWLDVAKGIAILCTIVGHTVAFGSQVRNLIFSFHMPLFFIIAGYTLKTIPKEKIIYATWKDFKRLIIPFLVMGIITVFLAVIFNDADIIFCVKTIIKRFIWGNGNDYNSSLIFTSVVFCGVGATWFLLALFWSKFVYRFFDICITSNRIIFLLFMSFLGICIGRIIRLPHCIDMIPLIMLFFECGRVIKSKVDMNSERWKCFGIISFCIWIFFAWDKGIYIEMAERQYPYTMMSVLLSILGSICVIQFSKSIEYLKFSKFLVFVGENSLDLLCIHSIDYYLSELWSIKMFDDGSSLFFANDLLSSILKVVCDVIILVIWCFIKKLFSKRASLN